MLIILPTVVKLVHFTKGTTKFRTIIFCNFSIKILLGNVLLFREYLHTKYNFTTCCALLSSMNKLFTKVKVAEASCHLTFEVESSSLMNRGMEV
jgi:hypothetical protein